MTMTNTRVKSSRHGRFSIDGVIELSHQFVRRALDDVPEGKDKLAVDVTVGNGYDTCWLAECVTENGQVIGCDVQSVAIDSASKRLEEAGLLHRVKLYKENHALLARQIPPSWHGQVSAIMANLGYLPGGDKRVISESNTSLCMIESLLPILRVGGVMTLVLYSGHPGGREETDTICTYALALNPKLWRVFHAAFPNQTNSPPQLLAVERLRYDY